MFGEIAPRPKPATVSAGTSGRIPFETAGGVLTDSGNLTYLAGIFGVNNQTISANGRVVTTPSRVSFGSSSPEPTGDNAFNFGAINTSSSSSNYCFMFGIANTIANTSTGNIFGLSNTISGSATAATFIGGQNTASGGASQAVAIGYGNTVTGGTFPIAIGSGNTISGTYSIATGTQANITRTNVFTYSTSNLTTPTFNFQSYTSTSTTRDMMDIKASWIVNTDASRTARIAVGPYSFNGLETGLTIDATGSGANLGLFGAGSYGGGVGVLFIPNGSTVPTSNPTGGGLLYVTGGALTFRGSSGTVTTLGPA